jgi:hypothetical protein
MLEGLSVERLMIISDTKKFIFIHIPKTGGMSVRKVLWPFATVSVWRERTVAGKAQKNKHLSKHAKANAIARNIDKRKWNSYFKFAIVRNPWDWLVSGYHYARRDKNDWRHKVALRLGFKDYVKWCFLESGDIRHNVLKAGQLDFILANGKIALEFVGRLERIRKDFDYICSRIGVRVKLPHVNKTRHIDYRKYYDSPTATLVGRMLKRDIEFFDYIFDGIKLK